MFQRDSASFFRRFLFLMTLCATVSTRAEEISAELDYFPSRLHAFVYRNWDVVPHERIATVLQTDVATIERTGKELGLAKTKPLTAEENRRNVEIILRRNWPLVPRKQIEDLLGYSAFQVDDYLNKEIFLRALLAGPPPGLTQLKFDNPDEKTKTRVKWFADKVKRHFKNTSDVREEPRLGYIADLCEAHNPADFIPGTKPTEGEIDLRKGWAICHPAGAGTVLKNVIADFADYCHEIHHCRKFKICPGECRAPCIVLNVDKNFPAKREETYALKVAAKQISITSKTEVGLARALVELERRMAERGGPFLQPVSETNSPAFNPRYVFSYFSLMTDVLGQDVVDPFPDGYLNQLFHQDADGVWIYALLEDLVPSPVFEGLGKDSGGLRRLRNIVDRAASRGLKVYIYLNEPRAQRPAFYEKYPDAKGQAEEGMFALCTSSKEVQEHLRRSFEKLFREVPGLGGVFVITASENLSNCYSHYYRTKISCPRCSKRTSAEVIVESIRCMAEGTWAANPDAKFIVWDWSWHSVLGEEVPAQIIKQLPKGVGLMADFERGTPIVRGGVPMNVEEYSISIVGPSARAKLRSEQATQYGFDFLGKVQLSTTWECGTVPFIPVPNLLARKAQALHNVGADGVMATWTIGSYPSPNTEAFSIKNWNPNLPEADVLQRIALRRYGAEAAPSAVRGWTKMSEAFTQEYPFFESYLPPLQHGPSLPLYRKDITGAYGNATLFNCKDDWRRWTYPFTPEAMSQLLKHLCDRWDDGVEDLKEAAGKASGSRRRLAERDLGVAWMTGYHWRAYAHGLDFYRARDSGNAAELKAVATRELEATEQAFRLVRSDSRLGWEAELQYFYRPLDVLERLLSLDAVLEPQ